jgi:hypothetical protein
MDLKDIVKHIWFDRAPHLEKLGQTGEQAQPHLIQTQVP